jgi:hypothetical protein
MFGLGKKKVTCSNAAAEFIAITHDSNEKTFESFKAKLQELLQGFSWIPGVLTEPRLQNWKAVKLRCLISQLAVGTNTIRVVFPDRHYNPMINHIGIALDLWEVGQEHFLRSMFFEDMLRVQSSIDAMSKGIAFTPDIAIGERFLTECGFFSEDFKPSAVSNMVLSLTGALLIEYNSGYWKTLSERGYTLVD